MRRRILQIAALRRALKHYREEDFKLILLGDVEELWQFDLHEILKDRDIEPVEKNAPPLPCYFNSGCALYSDGMTALEIADDKVRLVKWSRNPDAQQRQVFDDGGNLTLSDFVQEVVRQ